LPEPEPGILLAGWQQVMKTADILFIKLKSIIGGFYINIGRQFITISFRSSFRSSPCTTDRLLYLGIKT